MRLFFLRKLITHAKAVALALVCMLVFWNVTVQKMNLDIHICQDYISSSYDARSITYQG